jgi:uncharacterized membrane protein YkvA (DUF1232 family)
VILLITRFRQFAIELYSLYLATRDPRAPLAAKITALIVAFYVVLPFDFLPDVIPLAGLVDEFIIIPLGMTAVSRLLPANVRAENHAKAVQSTEAVPRIMFWVKIVAAGVVLIWLVSLAAFIWLLIALF